MNPRRWVPVLTLALLPVALLPARPAAAAVKVEPVVSALGLARSGGTALSRVRVVNTSGSAQSGEVAVEVDGDGGAVTASGTGWSCDAGVCRTSATVGTAGAYEDLLVTRDVPVTDRGSVTTRARQLGTVGWASVSAPVTVDSTADLALSAVPGEPVAEGATGSAEVLVSNLGTEPYAGPVVLVTRTAAGPAAASGAGWTCQDGTCTAAGPVPVGATLPPLALSGAAPALDPGGLPLSLTARLAGAADGTAENDATEATVAVLPRTRVDLTVQVSGGPAAKGAAAPFEVRVRNAGDVDRQAPVTVRLQEGSSGSGAGWLCVGTDCTSLTGVGALASLPPLTMSVPVPLVDAYVEYQVSATATLLGAEDGDPRNDTATAVVPVVRSRGGDLALRVDAGTQVPGRDGTDAVFRVRPRNLGRGAHPGPVSITLAADAVGPSDSPARTVTGSGDGWVCLGTTCTHAGPVPPGEEVPTLLATVPFEPGERLSSVSLVAALTPERGDDVPVNDVGSASTAARHTDPVPGATSLRLEPQPPAPEGSPLTVLASVRNEGPTALGGAGPVSRPIGVGVGQALARPVPGGGWTCAPTSCSYVGEVAPGALTPPLAWVRDADASPRFTLVLSAGSGYESYATTANGGPEVDVVAVLSPPVAPVAGATATWTTTVVNDGRVASAKPVQVSFSGAGDGVLGGTGWSCAAAVCTHPGGIAGGGSLPPITLTETVATGLPPLTATTRVVGDTFLGNVTTSLARSYGGLPVALTAVVDAPPPGVAGPFVVGVRNPTGTAVARPSVVLGSDVAATAVGDGWSCAGLTCERTEPAAAGASLPPLVVTPASPPGVTPRTLRALGSAASTSGGGPHAEAVAVVAAEQPLVAGATRPVTVRVTNTGDLPAGPLGVAIGFTGAGGSGSGWACELTSCTYAAGLAPGASAPPLTWQSQGPGFANPQLLGVEVVVAEPLGRFRTSRLVLPLLVPAQLPAVVAGYAFGQPGVGDRATLRFSRRISGISPSTVGFATLDGRPVPVAMACDGGPCTDGTALELVLTPLAPLEDGTSYVTGVAPPVLDEVWVSPPYQARPLAPRVVSFTPGTSSSRAPSTVLLDRDAAGPVTGAAVRLVDGAGAVVPTALRCAPGPCSGPVRSITLTPSTPLAAGRAYAVRVLPPLVGAAYQSPGFRGHTPPAAVVQSSPASATVRRGTAVRLVARVLTRSGAVVAGADVRYLLRVEGQTAFRQVRALRSDRLGQTRADARPTRAFVWYVAVVGPDGRVQAKSVPRLVRVR